MQEWQEKIEKMEREIGQLRQEVNQLKGQRQTDQMKAIDVASILTRLDTLEHDLKTHVEVWLNTIQEHYDDHKQAISGVQQTISDVQTVQRGHAKYFEAHGKRLEATATKSDISRLETDVTSIKNTQEKILNLLQQKLGE